MTSTQKELKNVLKEISELYVNYDIELSKIPSENTDMEPYEGTEIEDLANSAYYCGRLHQLEEIKELLFFIITNKS